MEEKFLTKHIDPNMFEYPFGKRSIRSEWIGFEASDVKITREGDGRTRKIQRKILLIHNDFNDMGIEPIPHLLNPRHEGGHMEGIVSEERTYRFINDVSFDKRFVSLDVDNDFCV